MTGLKDIKPVATLGRNPLYSAEQMQEYAKECVRAALKEYVGPYSDKKANSIILRVVK